MQARATTIYPTKAAKKGHNRASQNQFTETKKKGTNLVTKTCSNAKIPGRKQQWFPTKKPSKQGTTTNKKQTKRHFFCQQKPQDTLEITQNSFYNINCKIDLRLPFLFYIKKNNKRREKEAYHEDGRKESRRRNGEGKSKSSLIVLIRIYERCSIVQKVEKRSQDASQACALRNGPKLVWAFYKPNPKPMPTFFFPFLFFVSS